MSCEISRRPAAAALIWFRKTCSAEKTASSIEFSLRSQPSCAASTLSHTIPRIRMMVNTTIYESRPDMGTTCVPAVDMSPENSENGIGHLRHKERPMVTKTLGVLILLAAIAPSMRAKDEKLKPEQVIAKHLESIGPKEKLNGIKNRVTKGDAHVDIHVGGTANLAGNGILASEGRSLRLTFQYPALQYPGEQFV